MRVSKILFYICARNKNHMEVTEIKDIETKTLKAICKKLKKHVPKWALKLSAMISKHKDWTGEDDCSPSTARNIGAGFIASQAYRRVFVECAHELLESVSKEQNKIVDLAKKIA